MPTIGWFEILIVVAIAIVVLGPKDFPIMLKKVGSWIGTAKRYVNNIQNEVSNIDIENDKIEKIRTGLKNNGKYEISNEVQAIDNENNVCAKAMINVYLRDPNFIN